METNASDDRYGLSCPVMAVAGGWAGLRVCHPARRGIETVRTKIKLFAKKKVRGAL